MSGMVSPAPGATRHGIYHELRQRLCAEIDCEFRDLTVTSFVFERNEVGA